MKTKRNKANRRTMTIYNSIFKFREPYQVLFDADFAITVTTQKMAVNSRLGAVLGGLVKPMITQCSISHLIKLASEGSQVAQEAVDLTRKICERRKCNHWKTKASSVECIKGIIGEKENPLRYIVCTQDAAFRTYLRENIVGVPIIYVNRNGTLLLEEEGPATELRRKQLEEQKLHIPIEELEQLKASEQGLDSSAPVQLIQRTSQNPIKTPAVASSISETHSAQKLDHKLMKKKKHRKGGPNPLSVKKKKSSTTNNQRNPKPKAGRPRNSSTQANSLNSLNKKSKKKNSQSQLVKREPPNQNLANPGAEAVSS